MGYICTMRRLIPVLALVAVAVAVWASGLTDTVSWGGLARHQHDLARWVAAHPVPAAAAYALAYTAATALSVPAGAVLTAAGGLLFGAVAGAGLSRYLAPRPAPRCCFLSPDPRSATRWSGVADRAARRCAPG